ncbi:hypothetical protein PF005_g2409 [Phytophthora fragariae]|uniref:Uncharacterized protein n=1 Tax=Phytophthora fragariae TaxID=53985 RepID=A0A6A3MBR0_9STRA|nr:hypothetical protein PF009_g2592 [Phytophthora fragariae]KAE9028177.1 hypothetical protein PF011_g1698 [Phytophthora fragariae]KAE9136016.1 hypothetical protein PF007_g2337 [Phytophthora fragariae]KAE9154184.1 hypothetical protein PF006_g1753 [Phytophthora fragariae]KAE9233237.1 hypothetical protein PF005_g2409 [Phytophthora fragariae]
MAPQDTLTRWKPVLNGFHFNVEWWRNDAKVSTISSDTLRYRNKSVNATTTGLLLHKFRVDTYTHRARNLSRANTRPTGSPELDTGGKNDVIQELINAAPGCYPGDDGSGDIADRYNFFAHRKRFLFSPCSLGFFHERSRFRQALIWCITWKRFDQFILFLILANSVILAIADYSKVDAQGDLDSSQSLRNAIVNSADTIFTVLFAIECTMKIVAMGLFGEQGAYLMDPWNWMDFLVVFIGILAVIPGIPNVSMLRIFRVLRPLRSLNAVAGMKKLVSALLKSIPELLTVVAFLSFLFFLYGVIGVQLWSGVLHPRCRLTPYPLRLDPDITFADFDDYKTMALSNYSLFPCVDEYNDQIPVGGSWSHDTSPWKIPRVCFWPVAEESPARTCALDDDQSRLCPDGQTCGSDYDAYGNFRFTHPDTSIFRRILESSTYSADLNWGFLHFDNIGSASLAIFQCITREGWSDIMYMLQDAGYGTIAVVYFVSFIILGSFFMLNLTLAVIWDNFSEASFIEAEEKKAQKKAKAALLALRAARVASDRIATSRVQILCGVIVNHWVFNVVQTALILLNTIILSLDQYPIDQKLNDTVEKINFALTLAFVIEALLKTSGLGWTGWFADRYNLFDAMVIVVSTAEMILSPPTFIRQQSTTSKTASFSGLRSFRLFALFKLARSWPSLQKLLTTMISTLHEVGDFSVLFLLFLYIYALIGMQTFANQFRFDEYGFPVDRNQAAAYVPRANFDTMLWSVVTVFQILNVIMVCLLVFLIFSILAVNNLKGTFYSCQGDEFDALTTAQQEFIVSPRAWTNLTVAEQNWFDNSPADIVQMIFSSGESLTSRDMCKLLGATWTNTIPQNFDNVIHGIQTFFEMTTTEGWVTIMLTSVDATDIDMQPIPNHREHWTFFFISFILVGTFFVMQLFVGVVIENFNNMKEKLDGTYLLSHIQREWLNINEAMLNLRPVRRLKTPLNLTRRALFRLALSPTLEITIMGCVLLNTVFMAMDYFGEEDLYETGLNYLNYFFSGVFALEAVVKVIGLGKYYWKDPWNVFDFVVVLGTLFGVIYQMFGGSSVGAAASTVRSFRVGRLFRLVHSAPSLRQLFNTLLITLPSLANIGGLLFLVFFIYAAMGVQLFAKIKFGELITSTANFQSLLKAMITLVRCATGERWNDMMYELANQEDCTSDPPYDPNSCGISSDVDCIPLNGCGSPVAFIYLYSFTLLVTFILLNIFIAVILEGFAKEKDREDGVLLPQHYEAFVNSWSKFDPEATGFLEWHLLPSFLTTLEPPMGLGTNLRSSSSEIQDFVAYLDVPIYRGNKVFLNDVARRVGKFVIDELSGRQLEALPRSLNLEKRWRKYLTSRNIRKNDVSVHRMNQFTAAVLIHRSVNALVFREELNAGVQLFEKRSKARISELTTVTEL